MYAISMFRVILLSRTWVGAAISKFWDWHWDFCDHFVYGKRLQARVSGRTHVSKKQIRASRSVNGVW